MDDAILAQWIATGIIAIAVILTWVKNGRSQAKEWGSFTNEVKHIKEALEDPDQGLGALKKGITDMQTNCAKVSGKLGEKVYHLEDEVDELKRK